MNATGREESKAGIYFGRNWVERLIDAASLAASELELSHTSDPKVLRALEDALSDARENIRSSRPRGPG